MWTGASFPGRSDASARVPCARPPNSNRTKPSRAWRQDGSKSCEPEAGIVISHLSISIWPPAPGGGTGFGADAIPVLDRFARDLRPSPSGQSPSWSRARTSGLPVRCHHSSRDAARARKISPAPCAMETRRDGPNSEWQRATVNDGPIPPRTERRWRPRDCAAQTAASTTCPARSRFTAACRLSTPQAARRRPEPEPAPEADVQGRR